MALRSLRRDLDDDALDDPRQPRDLYSPRISYGLYEVTEAENDFGPQPGEKLIFADKLAAAKRFAKAKLKFSASCDIFEPRACSASPLPPSPGWPRAVATHFSRSAMLAGDHVTDDAGTGFVHTAPGHGREDFDVWMDAGERFAGDADRHAHPLHRRRCGLLHQGRAGLRTGSRGRGRARHRRQRQEGRRQQGRHRCADRAQHAVRARAAEAPVSAFAGARRSR